MSLNVKDTWTPEELDTLIETINTSCKEKQIEFVYGKGKRKIPIQGIYDNLVK